MRNICKVIAKITDKIPDLEVVFKTRLIEAAKAACYTPPEMQRSHWYFVSNILQEQIPHPPSQPWEIEVVNIFTGKQE